MTDFVNDEGKPKTYVTVDEKTQEVFATFEYFPSERARKDLQEKAKRQLTTFNLTHPKCPVWLLDLAWADESYCLGKAAQYDRDAASERRRAAALLEDADRSETTANLWRERAASAAADNAPKM